MFTLNQFSFRAIVLSLALSTSATWAEGGSNAGGGYSVLCADGGVYAMDYLATQKTVSGLDPEIERAKTSDEILARILKRLEEVRPELAISFQDFIARNDKEANTATTRLWVSGTHPLHKLTDEQSIRKISACLGDRRETEVFQAVIRQQFKRGIIYNRDAEQLARLEQTGAEQASFTYVHEWLRDFTDDSNIIMHVNYFLHSADFFTLSAADIERVFQRHGLDQLPGADRIQTQLVPPLSVVRIKWNGVVDHMEDMDFTFDVYLCQRQVEFSQVISVRFGPDLSDCQIIRTRAPRHLEINSGAITRFFLGNQSVLDPVQILLPGALLNQFAEAQGQVSDGPFLVAVAQSKSASGTLNHGATSLAISELINRPSTAEALSLQPRIYNCYIGGIKGPTCMQTAGISLKVDFLPLLRR